MLRPTTGNPMRIRMRSDCEVTTDPMPASPPFPAARHPDVVRSGRAADNFHLRRGRRFPDDRFGAGESWSRGGRRFACIDGTLTSASNIEKKNSSRGKFQNQCRNSHHCENQLLRFDEQPVDVFTRTSAEFSKGRAGSIYAACVRLWSRRCPDFPHLRPRTRVRWLWLPRRRVVWR